MGWVKLAGAKLRKACIANHARTESFMDARPLYALRRQIAA